MLNQSDELVAEYVYNGLGHRIGVHYDVNEDGDVDGDDPWFWFAYDERWRIVATFRADDPPDEPKEIFLYHAVGLGGFGGSSYIDSVILRDRDANTDWDAASDGVLEERVYYCQNWRHDVVALITDAGAQVQQVRYSAYGVPFGLPAGDVNSSGDVTSADDTIIAGWISGSTYDVRGDLDLDGDVDNTDRTALQARIGDSLGRENLSRSISSSGGGNRKGYAGYEADFSRDGFWHVRHRVLDSELGRWTRRDPLGYVDGVSLYQYASARALVLVDPMGLCGDCPDPGIDGCLFTEVKCRFRQVHFEYLAGPCSMLQLVLVLVDLYNCACHSHLVQKWDVEHFGDGESYSLKDDCYPDCECDALPGNPPIEFETDENMPVDCQATRGTCKVSATFLVTKKTTIIHGGICRPRPILWA